MSHKARRPSDPELKIARDAKRAGIAKSVYLELRTDALRKSAAKQGWRDSELAMSIASIQGIAERLWGKS